MTTEIYTQVTFYVPDEADKINALHAKARELDDANGGDVPEGGYTLPQALQIVWHTEPEWLHQNFLNGWTIDKASLPGGEMRPIWETT